jgi:RpiR family transcriptional regulator, carbohydrate utilization regulator
MSGAMARIEASASSFSKAEQRVAAYVRRHRDRVPFQSVHEVSHGAGVSVASVSRMVRQIGYADFKEFKIGLAQELSSPVSAIYAAIGTGDSDADVVRKVFGANVQSLQNTLKMLNIADCARAAQLLSEARRVVLFGIGTSGNVSRDAALRLSHLDIPAEAYPDPYEMLIQATRLRKGEVAIGISHSGRSSSTVDALRLAKRNGAVTIGISNFLRSPLHDASDLFFCTSFPERGVKSAALSAVTAQICLTDALYVLTARLAKATAGVNRINKLIEERFRLREKRR